MHELKLANTFKCRNLMVVIFESYNNIFLFFQIIKPDSKGVQRNGHGDQSGSFNFNNQNGNNSNKGQIRE